MRAVTIVGDNKLEVREHPDPVPGTGEVLVRVRAAGINNADLLQARGLYPSPPGVNADIPGLELAGEVVALGPDAYALRGGRSGDGGGVGRRARPSSPSSTSAPPSPCPRSLDWASAGGFPETFTTAHDAMFTQCRLGLGERVLISGGAGGVGTAGIQIAAAAGAQVTASVRSRDLWDQVGALGATVVDPEAFVDTGPYDVIMELIGAPNMPGNLQSLAVGGRIVVIGFGAGAHAELNLLQLLVKQGAIYASALRPRPLEGKAAAAQAVQHHVVPLLESGRITVPVAATFALDEAAAAYERFAAGGKLGKIVLVL